MVLAGDPNGALAQYDRALQETKLAGRTRVNILMRAADVHLGRNEPALAAARYDAALAAAGDALPEPTCFCVRAKLTRRRITLMTRSHVGTTRSSSIPIKRARINRWLISLIEAPRSMISNVAWSTITLLHTMPQSQRFGATCKMPKTPRSGDAYYYVASSYARQGHTPKRSPSMIR